MMKYRPIAWLFISAVLLSTASAQYSLHSGICGQPSFGRSADGSRIVNGDNSVQGAWPWQVLIQDNDVQICGGTLIAEQWVLTAAHCETGDVTSHRSVFLGAYLNDGGGIAPEEYEIEEIICHEDYDHVTFADDVCLFKLRTPVTYTDYIKPACLPERGTSVQFGDKVMVTGWGDTEGTTSFQDSKKLQEAEVAIVDTAECRGWYAESTIIIPEKHMCAGYEEGGIDTCQGDSGGPLVHLETSPSGVTGYVSRGVTSFGQGCARERRPGVYARTVRYLDWIAEKMTGVAVPTEAPGPCTPIHSTGCGGVVDQPTTIRSPNQFESNYIPNADCAWNIQAPAGFWITVTFVCTFELETSQTASSGCADYVTLFDGQAGESTNEICGDQLPPPNEFQSDNVLLRFVSDGSTQLSGFVAEITFVAAPTTTTTPPTTTSTTTRPTTTTTPSTTLPTTTTIKTTTPIPTTTTVRVPPTPPTTTTTPLPTTTTIRVPPTPPTTTTTPLPTTTTIRVPPTPPTTTRTTLTTTPPPLLTTKSTSEPQPPKTPPVLTSQGVAKTTTNPNITTKATAVQSTQTTVRPRPITTSSTSAINTGPFVPFDPQTTPKSDCSLVTPNGRMAFLMAALVCLAQILFRPA